MMNTARRPWKTGPALWAMSSATAKKRIGGNFAITCLYNVAEYSHPKATTFEEGVGFAKYLEAAGVDAIQVRAHDYNHRDGMLHPDKFCLSRTAAQSTQRPGLEPARQRRLGASGGRRQEDGLRAGLLRRKARPCHGRELNSAGKAGLRGHDPPYAGRPGIAAQGGRRPAWKISLPASAVSTAWMSATRTNR